MYYKKSKNVFKVLFVISLFFSLFFLNSLVFAEEKINSFDSQIKINSDASVLITETINYNFGNVAKHGIFRNIPISYKVPNGVKNINLELQSVTRDGQIENYEISQKGQDESIKIGNANSTIEGEHSYVIVYKIIGAINSFADKKLDELYWNVTGNGWPVGLENVSVSVEIPKVDKKNGDISCYEGVLNSKEKCVTNFNKDLFIAKSSRPLLVGEGLTIAVDFPQGVVDENAVNKIIINNLNEPIDYSFFKKILYSMLLLFLIPPIITLIIMFLIWRKYGRDPKGLSTIVAEYEPPFNMKPTLVGSLVDGKPDFKDITAGLIYLAEQGFLKIKKLEKEWFLGNADYEIELLKKDITALESTEQSIIRLFFEDGLTIGATEKISNLKRDTLFSIKANKIIKNLYQEMTDKGFFAKNPLKTKLPYIIVFAIFMFLGMFLFPFLIMPGVIVIIFSFFMKKKTKLGAETKDHILGFELFLSVTEKDRLDFHNAPEKNPEEFMKFLPYAIALGVEEKWAKQFENIYIGQPAWYQSNVVGSFVVMDFVSHMSSFSNSVSTGMAPAGGGARGGFGGGGGGFSGGGFGGGGGGSW